VNYDLAMMALEGLADAPVSVSASKGEVRIEGAAASFKELARLFLLLGGQTSEHGETFELKPGMHVASDSPMLVLRVTK
jgi:hypothetical protein